MWNYIGVIYHVVGNHERQFHFNFINETELTEQEIVEWVENGYGVSIGRVTGVTYSNRLYKVMSCN